MNNPLISPELGTFVWLLVSFLFIFLSVKLIKWLLKK